MRGSSVDDVLKYDALILYHFKLDPRELSDEEWGIKVNQVLWCLEQENKNSKI
jgi:hypothetical protein